MSDYKNKLAIVFALAALGLTYAAISFSGAYARSIQPSSFRSFAVSGEGKVVAVPDVAQFSFSVTTEGGKDLAKINTDNTNQYNKVVEFVKSKGVTKEDIETTESSINPRYQTYNCYQPPVIYQGGAAVGAPTRACPPAEIVGYTVTKSVSVKIRDFTKIGEIMGGVVSNGANQVGGLNFQIDDRSKVENDARGKAIAQAKEKAKSVAKAGGFRLGRLLAIEEGAMPYYYGRETYAKDMAMGMGAVAPSVPSASIEPGSDKVIINVTLRYEID
ncbi:MAG: SIMPL domain-containing protein [Patescibacteria group bacterium]